MTALRGATGETTIYSLHCTPSSLSLSLSPVRFCSVGSPIFSPPTNWCADRGFSRQFLFSTTSIHLSPKSVYLPAIQYTLFRIKIEMIIRGSFMVLGVKFFPSTFGLWLVRSYEYNGVVMLVSPSA